MTKPDRTTIFGIEEPFPWVGIVIWASVAAPIIGLVFAVVLGLSWSALS